MDLRMIQHIGIPVVNPQESLAFYAKLGFVPVMESPFTQDNGEGFCWMVRKGDITIELYQLPACELDDVARRRDGHIDHVAFDVDDIDAVFAELREKGFDIQEPAPKALPFWEKGCRYINIVGPAGERLEFCQIIK